VKSHRLANRLALAGGSSSARHQSDGGKAISPVQFFDAIADGHTNCTTDDRPWMIHDFRERRAMSDRLAQYLNDHLAGARFALELLERLQSSYANQPLGDLAAKLFTEISDDRNALQRIADEVGTGGSAVKEAASWLVEKASRIKLQLGRGGDLGTFEAVEALALGVLGKLKLWQALSAIKNSDARLRHLDFDVLIKRAKAQHDALEAHRMQLANTALLGPGGEKPSN
jgi:hypothetical protein